MWGTGSAGLRGLDFPVGGRTQNTVGGPSEGAYLQWRTCLFTAFTWKACLELPQEPSPEPR